MPNPAQRSDSTFAIVRTYADCLSLCGLAQQQSFAEKYNRAMTRRTVRWPTNERRIVVGQLARVAHNAPLHLFSASPELVGCGRGTYRPRSPATSLLLGQLFENFQTEGYTMSFTMADFRREYYRKHFLKLPLKERQELLQSLLEEQQEALQALPLEKRLAGLSAEQIRQYLDQLAADRPAAPRKPRRKK